jgi:hypothetical protein
VSLRCCLLSHLFSPILLCPQELLRSASVVLALRLGSASVIFNNQNITPCNYYVNTICNIYESVSFNR